MSFVFVDTSALIKRYIAERGSNWVRSWITPVTGNQTAISELAVIETLATLARLQRGGFLSQSSHRRLHADFLQHVDQEYVITLLRSPVLDLANELVQRHPLRALDAIHLASALDLARISGTKPLLIAADFRLLAAASIEGFLTDDPNNH